MNATEEAATARNIGDRYVAVALKRVKGITTSKSTTEPELSHALNLMLEVKEHQFGDTDTIKSMTLETAGRLFYKSYTGYSEQEKAKVLEREIDKRKRRT